MLFISNKSAAAVYPARYKRFDEFPWTSKNRIEQRRLNTVHLCIRQADPRALELERLIRIE